jgi:hypothetical protein
MTAIILATCYHQCTKKGFNIPDGGHLVDIIVTRVTGDALGGVVTVKLDFLYYAWKNPSTGAK